RGNAGSPARSLPHRRSNSARESAGASSSPREPQRSFQPLVAPGDAHREPDRIQAIVHHEPTRHLYEVLFGRQHTFRVQPPRLRLERGRVRWRVAMMVAIACGPDHGPAMSWHQVLEYSGVRNAAKGEYPLALEPFHRLNRSAHSLDAALSLELNQHRVRRSPERLLKAPD